MRLFGRDKGHPLFTFKCSTGFFRLLLLTFLSAEIRHQLVGTGTSPLLLDWKLAAGMEEKGRHFAVMEAAADKCGVCSGMLDLLA